MKINDVITGTSLSTLDNIDKLDMLCEQLDTIYSNIIVDRDNIKLYKKDLAQLRKVDVALAKSLKEVKERYLVPYKEFEKQVRERSIRIDNIINDIDKGVKSIEKEEEYYKYAEIESYFNELHCDFDLSKILNPKWLNKSCSEKQWKEEMNKSIIDLLNSPSTPVIEEVINENETINNITGTAITIFINVEQKDRVEKILNYLKILGINYTMEEK